MCLEDVAFDARARRVEFFDKLTSLIWHICPSTRIDLVEVKETQNDSNEVSRCCVFLSEEELT